MRFHFNEIKALNAVLWIAEQRPGADLHAIAKILYFSDKKSLNMLGKPVFGDSYVAMKDGPVPSKVYDMLKAVRGDGSYGGGLSDKLHEFFDVVDSFKVYAKYAPDLDCFSDMEIEFLRQSFGEMIDLSYGERRRRSHDKAYNNADQNNTISFEDMITSEKDRKMILEYNKQISSLNFLEV